MKNYKPQETGKGASTRSFGRNEGISDASIAGNEEAAAQKKSFKLKTPQITLPKGGGAIKSIDEKFAVNSANGTSSLNIALGFSHCRADFAPTVDLQYNSGAGQSAFGLGWDLSLSSITRKTDSGLPKYQDLIDSDTYIISDAEDLVPYKVADGNNNWKIIETTITESGVSFLVRRYRPRIEAEFRRIERWLNTSSNRIHWKVITKENITHIYGKDDSSCLTDPTDSLRIFRWMIEMSYDDSGNCVVYKYRKEDLVNVPDVIEENHRKTDPLFANIYIEKIFYGCKTPFVPAVGTLPQFMFQTVFDYCRVPADINGLDQGKINSLNDSWTVREDPFSFYRACFEIRTYRMCHRILHFHQFDELSTDPYLVRSINLSYSFDDQGGINFLREVCHKGYRKAGAAYTFKELPPFSFRYEVAGWNTSIKTISPESLLHAPVGLDDDSYQWVDLYNEGISGILSEHENNWYYKRNLGGGNFSPAATVIEKPSLGGFKDRQVVLQDLEGDGRKFLVSAGIENGYYELDEDNDWLPFRNFVSMPNIDFESPAVKFIDLDGDGRADILVDEDRVLCWYANKGVVGYDDYQLVQKHFNESLGPTVLFSDHTQSIITADINGDGLTDIVRVRNSEIAYWPNLGYGNFGKKVVMGNAPHLDAAEFFDPKNVILADINGSGTTDLIYQTAYGLKIFWNFGGNRWSNQKLISPAPQNDNTSTLAVVDLLGNGTSCIVWSSPLPFNQQSQVRYIDLMDGKKPFLLTSYENNLGKRVTLEYKSSTHFYLEDKKEGTPWITTLPFPVLCLHKVITEDLEFSEGAERARLRLAQTFRYHHGYFDYVEREFRGFGKVDQIDSESFDHFKLNNAGNVVEEALHQSPVKTVTWYHTGIHLNKQKVLNHYATEYYQNVFEIPLNDTVIEGDLTAEELREGVRACKGLMLRQEVYALDNSENQEHPFTITTRNCVMKRLQPCVDDDNAVFYTHESEAVEYHLERNPLDPRIAHQLYLEINDFGCVLKSASVVYGRKQKDASLPVDVQEDQERVRVMFSESEYTEFIDNNDAYRLAQLAEERSYELTGDLLAPNEYFTLDALKAKINTAAMIDYMESPSGQLEKRLVGRSKTIYLGNDLKTPLDFKKIESLGLPFQRYQMAMTVPMQNDVYQGRAGDAMFISAGYYRFQADNSWWIPSGSTVYLKNGESVDDARARFLQPVSFKDQFGNYTALKYDAYSLIVTETADPLQNTLKVLTMDYRTLLPYAVADINDNVNEVLTDELSMVVAASVYGEEVDGIKGDGKLDSYIRQSPATIAEVVNDPAKFLQKATTFYFYDLSGFMDRQEPVGFISVTREKHESSLIPGEQRRFSLNVQYSNGFGQVLQMKAPAEPGKALQWKDGQLSEVDTGPGVRWVGNGRTVFNNKGNAVKTYEPFFSTGFHYEAEKGLVEIGFPAKHYYDPLNRLIRKENGDGSLTQTVFDTWRQFTYDENDNVLQSDWFTQLGPINTGGPEPVDPEKRAGWLAAKHADTPLQSFLDSLGRVVFLIADNGPGKKYSTRIHLDVEGNERKVIDAHGISVMEYRYDMIGNVIYQRGADSAERWMFVDVIASPANVWDSRSQRIRTEYDVLGRPVKQWLMEDVQLNSPEKLINRMVYGEGQPNAKVRNLRGKVFQTFDQSGKAETAEYDFRGNIRITKKNLTNQHKVVVDWNLADPSSLLKNETFVSMGRFDALNRPVELTFPDNSKMKHFYNEAMLLQRIEMFLSRQNKTSDFVSDIEYNAKGQRLRILYGNNTVSRYSYDEKTFRLKRFLTTRNSGADILQDLNYIYDAVGNITEIQDKAQQTVYFNNALINPSTKYEYDPVYKLIRAEGREHAGQNAASGQFDRDKTTLINGDILTLKGDMNAMQRYEELYHYDETGNILELVHNAGNGGFANRWTRSFEYNNNDAHRLSNGINNAAVRNNQLLNEWVGIRPAGNIPLYQYDEHGNMRNLQKGSFGILWDFDNNLKEVDLGGGGRAYYVYDSAGQRVRKIIEKGNIIEERIYLGSYETFRRTVSNNLSLERESLHVMDNRERIALVESRIAGNDPGAKDLIRFQYSNQVGSAALEVSGDPLNPEIISYEEYYPFGSTAYHASRSKTETPKRYRYTGKERDEESGLYYHGARYYACWLVRWLSPDPIGIRDGVNVYKYVPDPVSASDPSGTECSYFDDKGNMYDICMDPKPTPNAEMMELRRKWEEENLRPKVVNVPKKTPAAKPQPKAEPVADAEPEDDSGTVGKPGFGESLIPIWGSGRESIYNFQKGNYGWGIVHGVLAVSDVFLLKSVVTAGGKLVVKGGATLIGKSALRKEGTALAAKQLAEKEAAELAAKELAKKEAAEAAAKELAAKEAAEKVAKELAEKEAKALAAKEAAKVGQIAYGSTDLAKVAIEFRKAQKLSSARNVAVFEYIEGGVKKTIAMASERGAGHSERLIAKELAKRGIDPSKVTRIFSELEPCVAVGGYCKAFISKVFSGAKVTFSFEYGATKASREAGVKALRSAVAEIFK